MAELKETSAFGHLLPLEIGGAQLAESPLRRITTLMPFDTGVKSAEALQEAHGMAWPKPNRSSGKDGARCIWFGRNEVLLIGSVPDAGLNTHCAVVDVSDGWAAATLSGAAAEDVLARLVPVDVRAAHFKRGHTMRTQLGHMATSITRVGADRFLILVFRSMAGTMAHELKQAMAAVASRG